MRRVGVLVCVAVVWPAGAAAAKTQLPGIRTPSRNISCYVVPGRPAMLRCDIRQADYAAELQHRCITRNSVDWHGFELSPFRKGTFTCSGGILYNPDTQAPHYTTLAYGKTWVRGPFSCTSRVEGLSCSNHKGHGLFVSRESWRRW